MSTTPAPEHGHDFVPTDELVRRQGVRPFRSAGDLGWDDPFSSDDEYAEFLRDLYDSRRRPA